MNAREDVEAVIDVNIFGQIIHHNWKLAFAESLDDERESVRARFDAIRQGRNLIAHPMNRDISKPQAESILALMARILSKAGAYHESAAIDTIREEMLDPRPNPVPGPAAPGDFDSKDIADLVAAQLSPVIGRLQADADELAEQITQRVARSIGQNIPEQPVPADIADAVLRRLTPMLTPLSESPTAAQTAEKMAALIREQSAHEDASSQLRRDFNHLAQQVADALETLQGHPQGSQAESIEHLRQDLQALGQQITGAIENLQLPQPGNQARPAATRPSRSAESAAGYEPGNIEPGNIEDNWKAVSQHLNRTKGKREISLGGLLRGARPVDIWMNLDSGKLMLPFRSPVILNKIQEELSYPEVREIIAESIARHFGKLLEIEPVLLN